MTTRQEAIDVAVCFWNLRDEFLVSSFEFLELKTEN